MRTLRFPSGLDLLQCCYGLGAVVGFWFIPSYFREARSICRRKQLTGLRLLCLLWALFPTLVHAQGIPTWLENAGNGSSDFGGDQAKRVWLVVGQKRARPVDNLHVIAMPAFIEKKNSDSRDYLYDLELGYTKNGEAFTFNRHDIASIRFYADSYYELSGAPVSFGYKPVIRLKNGSELDARPVSISPQGALNPTRFFYQKTIVTTFYGQAKERTEDVPINQPVLALAWTREAAQRVKDKIALRFVRNDANRIHLGWNKTVNVWTAKGPIKVSVNTSYKVTNERHYSSWMQLTEGTIIFIANDNDYRYNFSNKCLATDRFGTGDCGRQVRVSMWKQDPSGYFEKLYFGPDGMDIFYGTGNKALPVSRVNLNLVNVAFDLTVPGND